jgi:hypothetical protein
VSKSESGQIWRFYFVWGREAQRGERSGRKARPVCVQLVLNMPPDKAPDPVVLVPMTSQPPRPDAIAIEVPEIELRRAKLTGPCWLVFDDLNITRNFAQSPDRAEINPLGQFSAAFTRLVRKCTFDAVKSGAKIVQRDGD